MLGEASLVRQYFTIAQGYYEGCRRCIVAGATGGRLGKSLAPVVSRLSVLPRHVSQPGDISFL